MCNVQNQSVLYSNAARLVICSENVVGFLTVHAYFDFV